MKTKKAAAKKRASKPSVNKLRRVTPKIEKPKSAKPARRPPAPKTGRAVAVLPDDYTTVRRDREQQAQHALAAIRDATVTTRIKEVAMVNTLTRYKALYDNIEEWFDRVMSPIKEALGKLREERDATLKPIKEGIELGKEKLEAYYESVEADRQAKAEAENERDREREREERRARALKMLDEGKSPEEVNAMLGAPTDVEEPMVEAAQSTAGAQRRGVKELVIDDEALIPDEYWVIDEVKLRRAALLAHKEHRVIPGCHIGEKPIIALSAARE